MRTRAGLMVIGALLAAGCGSTTDEVFPTTTTAPPTTASSTTTTTASSTTTTAAPTTTTTTVPSLTARGFIWDSSNAVLINADDQPTTDVDGVKSAIDMLLVLGADEHDFCAEESERHREIYGGDLADQCLVVLWRYQVSDEFLTNQNSPNAGLSMRSIVTADRRQYDSIFGSSALPGTVDNIAEGVFPHGGEGSTIYWSTGSNLVGWTQHTYIVPKDLPLVLFD